MRVVRWCLCCALLAVAAIAQDRETLEDRAQTLRNILYENILPFWFPQSIDRKYGGYRLHHDLAGQYLGDADKYLVTQARMVWFFSRLYRLGLGDDGHLIAARHGYEFLRDAMWDKEHGGFHWAVDHRGKKATMADRHLYGQAFGLYALSEYALASGDAKARQLANAHFALLDARAHDGERGGYIEYLRPDWSYAPPDSMTFFYTTPSTKLMNTHLHLMEALTSYYRLSRDSLARERLIELIQIQSNAVWRKRYGACTDGYQLDWTPLTGRWYELVYYGHDIENVWMLIEALDAAGLSSGPFRDFFRQIWDYGLDYGYDHEQGGFFNTGRLGQVAEGQTKIFWVQGEAMLSALYMYRLTGEERYFGNFSDILRWIDQRQVDWSDGEWFEEIDAAGVPKGVKAGEWKAAYHHGRAVMESLVMLEAMLQKAE
ncbi:MAG: AGE family epimerase/isomerase [Candidatus Latescibacterota bacterium]|nr:AGE family epimerase/isomerase [Candidatus Latescibacterota bacterium]